MLLLASCATGGVKFSPRFPEDPAPSASSENAFSTGKETPLSPLQTRLVESADWALGRRTLQVKGRRFNQDCSGVVTAIYYRAGVDLTGEAAGYAGGGVERLYSLLEAEDLLYLPEIPAPGDLLFWDDSFDADGNGKRDDPLTHMGMVVAADPAGNIRYIHHNYRKGIVLASLNLRHPDDPVLNSPMRARNAEPGHAPLWLSSHLLRRAGKAYELGADR